MTEPESVYSRTDTDTLLAWWTSAERQCQVQEEIKGRIELELQRRLGWDEAARAIESVSEPPPPPAWRIQRYYPRPDSTTCVLWVDRMAVYADGYLTYAPG